MIPFFALALMQAAPAPASVAQPAEEDVVVIGRRLKDWRATWKKQDGRIVCITRRSTGDSAVDAIGCDAMTECLSPLVPGMDAIMAAKQSRRAKTDKLNALVSGQAACMEAARNAGVERLAAARRGT